LKSDPSRGVENRVEILVAQGVFRTLQFGVILLMVQKSCTSGYGSLSHYLQGFIHPRWCRISSINSSNTGKSGKLGYSLLISLLHKSILKKQKVVGKSH